MDYKISQKQVDDAVKFIRHLYSGDELMCHFAAGAAQQLDDFGLLNPVIYEELHQLNKNAADRYGRK